MMHRETISLESRGHGHMINLDDRVEEIVASSGIQDGLVHVFHVGSTGVIGMIEYEPGLAGDLPEILDKLIPPGRHYGHEQTWHDGNAHSHLQATILGPSLTVPLEQGQLLRGTWQQIIFLECDVRPRTRTVIVTIMG
jgi:secondary thiamine-phosphate synthase enzyme